MTTEKCPSVCLLDYDKIFSSPKNRPCRVNQGHLWPPVSIKVKKYLKSLSLSFFSLSHLVRYVFRVRWNQDQINFERHGREGSVHIALQVNKDKISLKGWDIKNKNFFRSTFRWWSKCATYDLEPFKKVVKQTTLHCQCKQCKTFIKRDIDHEWPKFISIFNS